MLIRNKTVTNDDRWQWGWEMDEKSEEISTNWPGQVLPSG